MTDEKTGLTIYPAMKSIPPEPDKWTGAIPPMEKWPDPIQVDRTDPAWSHSGRGTWVI